jgi:hypothetical protein
MRGATTGSDAWAGGPGRNGLPRTLRDAPPGAHPRRAVLAGATPATGGTAPGSATARRRPSRPQQQVENGL